jgi:hypothetical protein
MLRRFHANDHHRLQMIGGVSARRAFGSLDTCGALPILALTEATPKKEVKKE